MCTNVLYMCVRLVYGVCVWGYNVYKCVQSVGNWCTLCTNVLCVCTYVWMWYCLSPSVETLSIGDSVSRCGPGLFSFWWTTGPVMLVHTSSSTTWSATGLSCTLSTEHVSWISFRGDFRGDDVSWLGGESPWKNSTPASLEDSSVVGDTVAGTQCLVLGVTVFLHTPDDFCT